MTSLDRADALDRAASIGEDGPAESLFLATGAWVKGLAFDGEGWRVVRSVSSTTRTGSTVEGVRGGHSRRSENAGGRGVGGGRPRQDRSQRPGTA